MNYHRQNILIPITFSDKDKVAIEHGKLIAKAFNKDITLLAVVNEDTTDEHINTTNIRLEKIKQSFLSAQTPRIFCMVEKGILMPILKKISDEIEAASIIIAMEKNSRLRFYKDVQFIKETKQFKMPFLMVHSKEPHPEQSNVIYLPIGFRKEEKEKLIWASYFGRFNNSRIKVIKARESDSTARGRVTAHIQFAKKFFDQFNLDYEILNSSKSSFGITKEALQLAHDNKKGIVMICTTKHYGPEEEIIGPPELKVIKNREQVPVFCVNPRKDLYILCE